jgi:hypothetical protein
VIGLGERVDDAGELNGCLGGSRKPEWSPRPVNHLAELGRWVMLDWVWIVTRVWPHPQPLSLWGEGRADVEGETAWQVRGLLDGLGGITKNEWINKQEANEAGDTVKIYHVEPFYPNITDKQARKEGAGAVSEQMQTAINRFAADGWVFERYEGVQTAVSSGCLWVSSSQAQTYHMLVFSKEIAC